MSDEVQKPAYEGYALVEIMGRRQRAGYVREVQAYGAPLLRIDTPMPDGTTITEFYGGQAIFSLQPCDQEMAEVLAQDRQPAPVNPWHLERSLKELEDYRREKEEEKTRRAAEMERWRSGRGDDPIVVDQDEDAATGEDLPF